MRSQREEVRSGIAKVEGYFKEFDGGKEITLPWKVFLAFDVARGLYRIDQDLPALFQGGTTKRSRIKYVQTPDRCLEWLEPPFGLALYFHPAEYQGHDLLKRIDPRTIGLAGTRAFSKPLSLEEIVAKLDAKPFECEDLGGGLQRLYCTSQTPSKKSKTDVYIELVLNEREGMTPIRMEHRLFERGRQLLTEPKQSWPEPVFQAEATWLNKGGVWVPKSVVVNEWQRGCNLHFDWLEVNTEISQELFSEEGMGLANITMVDDLRLGKPISLGMLSEVLDKRYRDERKAESRRSAYWTYLLMGIAAIAIPAIVVWWWKRSR